MNKEQQIKSLGSSKAQSNKSPKALMTAKRPSFAKKRQPKIKSANTPQQSPTPVPADTVRVAVDRATAQNPVWWPWYRHNNVKEYRRAMQLNKCLLARSNTSTRQTVSRPLTAQDEMPPNLHAVLRYLHKHEDGLFYLVPAVSRRAVQRDYYNLEVVTYTETDRRDEYFVISAKGVSHVKHKTSEALPLDEWERGYRKFLQMKMLKTFIQFRLWKQFHVWHLNLRKRKFWSAQRELSNQLFLVMPCLLRALTHIHQLCNVVREMTLLQLEDFQTWELHEFVQDQQYRVSNTAALLNEFNQLMVKVVGEACCTALFEAGRSNATFVSSLAAAVKHSQEVWATRQRMSSGQCLKLLQVGGYWPKPSREQRIDAAEQADKLTRFVYLADLITMEAMRQILLNTVMHLEDAIVERSEHTPTVSQAVISLDPERKKQEHVEPKKIHLENASDTDKIKPIPPALFSVHVGFNEIEISLEPTLSQFANAIDTLLDNGAMMTEKLINICSDPQLEFIFSTEMKSPSLTYVLNGDLILSEVRENAQAIVGKGYEIANVYKQSYVSVQKWYYENTKFEISQLRTAELDPDIFAAALNKYIAQSLEVDQIPNSYRLGVFSVSSVSLRDMVQPSPFTCLEQVHKLMPQLTEEGIMRLTGEAQETQETLELTPVSTEELANYITTLDHAIDHIQAMQDEASSLTQMMDTMDDLMTPYPPELPTQCATMKQSVDDLYEVILSITHGKKREVMLKKLSAAIASELRALRLRLETQVTQLNDPALQNQTDQISATRKTLKEHMQKLQNEHHIHDRLVEIQEKFDMEVGEMYILEMADNELRTLVEKWSNLLDVEEDAQEDELDQEGRDEPDEDE